MSEPELNWPDEETERLWEQVRARTINIELNCHDIKNSFTIRPVSTDWNQALVCLARIAHHAETMGHQIIDYARARGILDESDTEGPTTTEEATTESIHPEGGA